MDNRVESFLSFLIRPDDPVLTGRPGPGLITLGTFRWDDISKDIVIHTDWYWFKLIIHEGISCISDSERESDGEGDGDLDPDEVVVLTDGNLSGRKGTKQPRQNTVSLQEQNYHVETTEQLSQEQRRRGANQQVTWKCFFKLWWIFYVCLCNPL